MTVELLAREIKTVLGSGRAFTGYTEGELIHALASYSFLFPSLTALRAVTAALKATGEIEVRGTIGSHGEVYYAMAEVTK